MKNLPKEKRDRLILIAIATVLTVFGVYSGVIRNQQQSLTDLARKHANEERRVTSGQRLAAATADLEQQLAVTQKRLKSYESTMASGDMYSWIILTMNSFKENGGYKVEIPQFSREVASEVGMMAKFPYRAAIFHVRGTAFYHDFGRFVADFENTYPFMRIQNIDVESVPSTFGASSEAEDSEKLSFKMEIVTLVNPLSR